jgi:signal transduction histidine kinase/CheY-like chemotaxis protein
MVLLHTIFLLTTPLFTLFLLGYVYGQRRKNRLNHAFLALIGSYFLLTMCDFMVRVIPAGVLRHVLLATATSLFFISSFIFLYFMYAFVKRKNDGFLVFFTILGSVAAAIPVVQIPLHGGSFIASTGIYSPLPNGLFAVIFVLYIFPVTAFGLWLALHAYRIESDRADKKRLFLWISGIVTAFLYLVGVSFIFPRLFNMPFASSFVSLAIIIVDLFTYWSVRRYNFLTVNIRQVEEILEKVFKDAGDAILLVDQNRKIVRANDAATGFFAISPDVIGTLLLSDIIPEIGTQDSLSNFETEVVIFGGRRSIVVTKTNLLAADETVHHLVIIRDMTRAKQAEQEQLRTQQLESLGVLAGGIAHDFNNFLCGIVSSFAFAKMNVGQDTEIGRILAEGENAALSARGLTQQLLTFAKGGSPVLTVSNAVALIHDACTFSASGGRIKLEFELPAKAIRVRADEGQIRQVFQNVVLNASQAMSGSGVIRVCGAVKEFAEGQLQPLSPGQYLEVNIIDHGCGIAPEILPRIFEPYFSTKKTGSGLGLAIAYRIIKRHNGHITVASEAGKGSIFTIYIPIDTSSGCDAATEATVLQGEKEARGRVLIMDDAKVIRMTLSMLLKQLGYQVDESATGEEALAKFELASQTGNKYEFIISDLTVAGGMGGKELAREIASRDPEIPIIVSSGYSAEMEIAHYKDFGFAGVLRKPYSIQELRAALLNAGASVGTARSKTSPRPLLPQT